MKKKYVKPEIFFEKFEVSQQIAACDYDSNDTHSDEGCGYSGVMEYVGPVTILVTPGVCTHIVEDYCYHNGSGLDYNLFNS